MLKFFPSRFHLLLWLSVIGLGAIVGIAGDRDLGAGILLGFGLGWLAFVG